MDRYYDPSTDQFLSVDPDLAETGQAYAFTGDDPLNATDPLGLHSVYVLLNKEEQIYYVGRSKLTPRRESEHKNTGKLPPLSSMRVLDTGDLSKEAAAGLEQLLIEAFGMKRNGGVLDNQKNGVANPSASKNYTYDSATVAGAVALGRSPEALNQINRLAIGTGSWQIEANYAALKVMSELALPNESPSLLKFGIDQGLAQGHV